MTLSLAQPVAPAGTDAAAIDASLRDPEAFAEVFDRHHPAVHRYLARRLGIDLADELAAEAFAVAFARRARYDHAYENARPWLLGIATRLVKRHWRREERELRAYARSGRRPRRSSPRRAIRADSAAAGAVLAAALAALSREERDVLLLYAWEELGYPEIARALSIAPGTVKSRLHRARRRVRASLTAAGELHPLGGDEHE